jgi:transposase
VRDSTVRELAHAPLGWRPTTLRVRLRRYRCTGCGHVWRHDLSCAATPRCKLTKTALAWALEALVVAHLSMTRIADALGVAWDTANTAVLAEGRRRLISDDTRFEGVKVIGVDEHVWRHTRKGDKYVTVIIDLTGVRDGTGTARLLDMIEGRSKAVFKTWLGQRDQAWRDGIEAIAMDGFTGFKTAAVEEVPQAVTVMDPFHVVHLAADALDECRRRTQQDIFGRRGRAGDPLYRARRSLHTGADLLTNRQKTRLQDLFAEERHTAVEVTWGVYQRTIAAYRDPDRASGKATMSALIDTIAAGVPSGLPEVARLGRTLARRADDVLAFFDRPGTSNGPTEAINGRLEHLRGIALGFRNLTHYIARSLLETGGFKQQLHR